MDKATMHFVRFPHTLLRGLMIARFTGVEFRVVLWVVRKTAGWNQRVAAYSWYRAANELQLDRAGVWRAGRSLLAAGVLYIEDGHLGVECDPRAWDLRRGAEARGLRALTGVNVDGNQRKASTVDNGGVEPRLRNGGLESTLFRRAKDSRKDNSKTYKDTWLKGDKRPGSGLTKGARRGLPTEAGRRNGGKYGGLSEN